MKVPAPTILVADDQDDVLEAMRLLLKPEGYRVRTASSPREVMRLVRKEDFDLLIMDLNYHEDTTSGKEGLELIEEVTGIDDIMPVVVMTAWGSIEIAVEAMRLGARDFLEKPWDNAKVLATVKAQLELSKALRLGRQLEEENRTLKAGKAGQPTVMIAEAPSMKPVIQLIERVAPADANVLITGENGTGKGVVARVLHERSSRAGGALVTVNTGGLAEGLFESELFGHVKGAFTDAKTDRAGRFELADKGTLFLDEIANVPLNQQAKLLRVLETGEFERVGSSKTRRSNARILSATNANLNDLIGKGEFRQDLLFRLNTIEIALPALRDRREDILLLAQFSLERHCRKYRREITEFDEPARRLLLGYAWPGNVRELNHVVERAVLMASLDRIRAEDLGLRDAGETARSLEDMSMEEVECFLVKKSLKRSGGNVSRAAEALGLSRSAFYRRLEKYGI